ncbi:hypothetical protein [Xanthomarina sp. F2636L]|uniref:hypothetical protein n=1 Tax=Xanthomarina sp. F2636L TaxID=2996018 RepID=UPI00225E6404|nr:hypothetical protein [Xanthomarina sp. F2636L]MCX7550289.1 hypothetical protein [Xanthomarina sp. F2636L]
MEKEFYHCEYCFKEFEPTRRRVQKFCGNSCRSKAHHAKNSTKVLTNLEPIKTDKPELEKQSVNKVEKMSASGIGNATAGSLFTDSFKS